MAVEVYLVFIPKESQQNNVQSNLWFGSAVYIDQFHELVALKGKVLDPIMIERLLVWPRDPEGMLSAFHSRECSTSLDDKQWDNTRAPNDLS